MISVQININDKKVCGMSRRVTAPVPSALLRGLKGETRDALTWEEYAKMAGDLVHDHKDRQEWEGVVLYEQQLENMTGDTYEPGHKVLGYDNDGGDKLLKAEVEFLSPLLVYLFEKYKISPGKPANVKFQVIYLGASSGVTESAQKGQILQHVEKLMTMFPKELIDFWWLVDPRPMTFSGRHRNYKHLQCLFSSKEMKDFNVAQEADPSIRYIVISDIRTPINYDVTNAPRAVMRDVLGAYYLCEKDNIKKKLLTLLGDVANDAREKAELVETIIKRDQKYQRIVRNTMNLEASLEKKRVPYFYPYNSKDQTYNLDNLPRFVQIHTPLNSTELREVFIVKDVVYIGGGGGVDMSESVLTKEFRESESENLLWSAKSDTRDEENEDADEDMQDDENDDEADEAKDQSVNLQDFDNKLAAYNHNKGGNEEKLQKYIKSLYETCYQKCTGKAPTEEQMGCLVAAYHRAHSLSESDEDLANQLFWEWFKDKGSRHETFLKSPKCVEIKGSVETLKSSKAAGYEVIDDMSSLVTSLLVKNETAVMDKLMQVYEKDVRLRQVNLHNYSNYGCNAKCPLFIERSDVLMHIRILLLIKHDQSIVGDWLDQYMVTENKEKYTALVQRLLSVYDEKSNDSLSIKHKFSFEEEEKKFKEIAKAALTMCKTENALQYMLGYVNPALPLPDKFLNTRHWAIVFYNSCVRRIVEMKLAFEYPFTETNKAQNIETLADLRNFFMPYLQKGEKDGCYYLGSNPAWNTACWPSGNPILHCAAQYGCTALVYLILTEYLPENSGLINFQRKKERGRTALHLAVYFKHTQVEKLLLAFKADENIRSVEKGKWESVLDLRRERGTDRLPKLAGASEESKRAVREIHGKKPDEFRKKVETFPEARDPRVVNRSRTNAPEVKKKAEDTDNTDSEGDWEVVKGDKKTQTDSKKAGKAQGVSGRAKTGGNSRRFAGGQYPYSPGNSTKRANLSDLLEELEKNI
jgi:hypothetical protein